MVKIKIDGFNLASPSLKTSPVKAAKRGPTSQTADGLSITYCIKVLLAGWARAM